MIKAINEEQIISMAGVIRKTADPCMIWLFGSAATGKMTPDSDVDFLVVIRNANERNALTKALYYSLSVYSIPVDIVVVSRDYYEMTKNLAGGIVKPATGYGRLLYHC